MFIYVGYMPNMCLYMWWLNLHNHVIVRHFSRKRDRVSNLNPTSIPSDHTDTEGMDKLFRGTLTPATTDSSQRKSLDVSISQAAKILGISERTVWRKINRGELKSRTRGNKRVVKVPVFEPTSSTSPDGQTTITDTPPNANAVVDLNVLLHELQGANYRIGYLEAENKRYEEQIKLLPDFQAQAAEAAVQEARIKELETELEQLKANWWYRFCSWAMGRSTELS